MSSELSFEALCAAVFETADLGITVTDEEGRFVAVNPAYCRMYGYSREELLGRSFFGIIVPEDPAHIEAVYRGFLEGTLEYPEELTVPRKDGERFDVLITARRLLLPSGRKFKVTTVADISRRKRAEARAREEKFSALAEHSPDVIARIDRNLRYLYVNPAVEKYSGIPPEHHLGRTPREAGAPEEFAAAREAQSRQVFAEGRERVAELCYAGPKGKFHFESRLVPERDETGEIATLLVVSRDITQRKRMEEALRHEQRQLVAITDALPAMIAHRFEAALPLRQSRL